MKTIQFTGTSEQISNLNKLTSDFDEDRLPSPTDTMVYLVDGVRFNAKDLRDKEFVVLANEYGVGFNSIADFQKAFNEGNICSTDLIRFVNK